MPPLSRKRVHDRVISNFKIPKSPPKSDFPSDVLKHIKKNANPKQAIKLLKVNKFFIQEKCSFIYTGENVNIYNDCVSFFNKRKKYKINEIPNNLVMGTSFKVYFENLLPQLISKILICDLKYLYVSPGIKVSLKDFKFLTSSKSFFELHLHGKVVDKDGIIPYESLLDHVPSLRHFLTSHLPRSQLTNNFFEKFCASNLEMLSLCHLTKSFDVESFLNSMKKKPNLRIHFHFEKIVKPGKVNAYIDKLVAADKHDSRPPYFDHSSLDDERRSQIENLQKAYDLKIRGDL